MPQLLIPEPFPQQIKFFEAKSRYVAFGGARGGGKSWSVRIKAVLLALNNPRNTDTYSEKNINRT